jgi:hypothetical protein
MSRRRSPIVGKRYPLRTDGVRRVASAALLGLRARRRARGVVMGPSALGRLVRGEHPQDVAAEDFLDLVRGVAAPPQLGGERG